MTLDTADAPNIYAVWIALITTVGPIIAGVVTYFLNRKLKDIHVLVNGNLHAAQQKVAQLRTKLVELGHDPDA